MESIYFETSAANYLFDNVFSRPDCSSIKTKNLQKQKGSKWYISNITLWEIFLTKNEKRRYDLFDFSRCLFYDYLIPSPEEIIINYIKGGCPIIEKRYELKSESLFAKEWTMACKNLNYAFQPDRYQLELRSQHFRSICEYFVVTKRGYLLSSYKDFNTISGKLDGAFIEYIFNKLLEIFG